MSLPTIDPNAGADPYPAVLELVGRALSYGYRSDNIGGSEPDILVGLAAVCHDYLAEHDPASAGFIVVPGP